MASSQVTGELQVSDDGLRVEGGWCEALAGKLAGDSAPTGTGSADLASAAVVNGSNAQVSAAGIRCTFRMQATAAKLAAAATGFAENEASSAAHLRAVDMPEVC
jgi:hypothetical protein